MLKIGRVMLAAAALAPLLARTLEINDAYVRGLPPTQRNTAAFFTAVNTSDKPIELMAGESDAAERIEIHSHQHRDGMMLMQEQASVTIGAGERFVFAPGKYHLMFINITRPVRDGEEVSFSLKTSSGQEVTVVAPVVSVLKESTATKEHSGMHP
ncbi:copper chaperone PCu(A)C [Zhongshania sp.]|uniref:copper chaperone PCu(A)C n=1 Tax=Zhongshania sp. TaxID=1971902 RepID=UPI001B4D1E24|nr:copper chaperone PCu(A)C [Zhongshania sp.]MBQ0795273.1 copper chaperone PCu(A)C [Zhongshania sp.]